MATLLLCRTQKYSGTILLSIVFSFSIASISASCIMLLYRMPEGGR